MSRGSRGTRFLAPLVAIVLAVLLLGIHSSTALGAEVKRGDQVEVPFRATIDDDLYIVARRAVIQGTVTGDVTAATAFLNSVGAIGGNLTVASGRVEVRGLVAGDVRALGATTAIYGDVEGDVVVTSGTLTLVEGAKVAGDIVVLGGEVQIVRDAVVGGNLRGAALSVTVEGRLQRNLDLTVRRLHLTPGAQVDGDLRYRSAREARLEEGATIVGSIKHRDVADLVPFGSVLLWSGGAMLRLLMMVTVGGALLFVAPRELVATADKVRSIPLETSLAGVVLGCVIPIAVVLLALTVVGLPLALFGAGLFAVALYLSQAIVGLGLGRQLIRLSICDSRKNANFAALSLGVIVLSGLRLIPVAGAEIAVAAGTAAIGLGATVLALIGYRESETKPKTMTRTIPGLLTVITGCICGFVVAVGMAMTIGAGALWMVATFSSTSASSQLTLAFDRDYLALVVIVGLAVTMGASALALAIYRHI